MKFASLCYSALRISRLTTLARRLQRGGVILCYHDVVAPDLAERAPTELGLHMSLETFARQARWLAARYDIVPLDALVDRMVQRESLRGTLAITFDDAYASAVEHAWPVLRALRIPATVFVVADAPGRTEGFWWDGAGSACRPAGWPALVSAAQAGLRLGAHSVTHPSLPELDEAGLQREIVESRAVIERHTGVTPEFFAYPYGHWSERVRDAVRRAGYRGAVTLDYGQNTLATDPWRLRRVNVPAEITDAAFHAWTAGLALRGGR